MTEKCLLKHLLVLSSGAMLLTGCSRPKNSSIVHEWVRYGSDYSMRFYEDGHTKNVDTHSKDSTIRGYSVMKDSTLLIDMDWDDDLYLDRTESAERALDDNDYYYLNNGVLIYFKDIYYIDGDEDSEEQAEIIAEKYDRIPDKAAGIPQESTVMTHDYPELIETVESTEHDEKSDLSSIRSIDDLEKIRQNLSGSYILESDLDFSDIDSFEPIGDTDHPFTGRFYGTGHVLRNIRISKSTVLTKAEEFQNYGFFGTADHAYIDQLGIIDASYRISADSSAGNGTQVFLNMGGIVGQASDCELKECWFDGILDASASNGVFTRLAGIVAIGLNTDFTGCLAEGSISIHAADLNSMAGGICAWFDRGEISDCVSWLDQIDVTNENGYIYIGGLHASGTESTELASSVATNCLVIWPQVRSSGAEEYTSITDYGLTGDYSDNCILTKSDSWSEAVRFADQYMENGSVWNIKDQNISLRCFEQQ